MTTNIALSTSGAVPNPGAGLHASGSLYVGDLALDVTEANLFEIFSQAGAVSSIRVCRDSSTRRSLGYAYVNFHSVTDAEKALDSLNFTAIKGRPCRVMWSHRDPAARRNTQSNVFVKNLAPNVDSKALFDTFSIFGNILSCKVVTDPTGQSKGFGFVHFSNVDEALKAIEGANDKVVAEKKIYVGKFEKRQDRTLPTENFTNVYVKNLPAEWDEAKFREVFSEFGKITSVAFRKNETRPDGLSFGFVNYETHPEAVKAVNGAPNIPVTSSEKIYAARFQKKQERLAFLHGLFEERKREQMEKSKNKNLYVKNLDESVDTAKLKELFAPYGETKSVTVMVNERGVSKGFGFVCFAHEEDALKAMQELNGRVINGKPLYVNRAQRKEERRSHLEMAFMQTGHPRMPPMMYFPNMVQPMMYPPQAYRPRPAPQVAPRQYPGYFPPQQARGPRPQQQLYAGGRGGGGGGYGNRGAPMAAGGQGQRIRSGPQTVPAQRYPPRDQPVAQQPVMMSQELSASMLANAPPELQKQILGERLYPLVYKQQPEHAAKITGMFLEMETSEILSLLDSHSELASKIQEALIVLQQSA